jgi:amidase
MRQTELHWLSLTEISALLTAREISPLELTRAILERIERVDPVLRSYAKVAPERALEAARRAEAEIERGERRGPLQGVPIAVKDLCDTKGLRTAAGTRILADRVPNLDSTVVERLEAAGAVLLGKLQMTEGASAVHHPDVEPPRNPWDLERWTGASSSGSAAATAGGLCFGSLGSDTAGSIRSPSLCCGLVGLKPSYGRVSRAGIFPLSSTLDHVGPITRTAADAAAMLGAIAGSDPRDPSALRTPVPDLAAELERGIRGVRVGVDLSYASDQVEDELAKAVLEVRAVLTELGADVIEVRLPRCEEVLDAGAHILSADVALAHAELFPGREEDYGPHLRELIEIGRGLSALDLARAHERRREWNGRLGELFEEIELLLCPPGTNAALPAAAMASLPGDFRSFSSVLRFSLPYNVSGNPTLTVPCGFNGAGLPLAFQLVGRPLGEGLLCRAGAAYQRETDWHLHHPAHLD